MKLNIKKSDLQLQLLLIEGYIRTMFVNNTYIIAPESIIDLISSFYRKLFDIFLLDLHINAKDIQKAKTKYSLQCPTIYRRKTENDYPQSIIKTYNCI